MAASPAITTVRAAELFVFFVAERDATAPAIASGNVNIGFVNKFHDGIGWERCTWGQFTNKKAPTGRGFDVVEVISLRWSHIDGVLVQRALDAEGNRTINQCKQSVILADADIDAWVKLGAALAHDDAACVDHFATKLLDAQHFWL